MRSLNKIVLGCLLGALLWPVTVHAGDQDFDRNTVLLLSTDDWPGLKTAMTNSDMGAFLRDPQIQNIGARLNKAVRGLISMAASQSPNPGQDAQLAEAVTGLVDDYCDALWNHASGGFHMSLGYRNDPEAGTQPQLLVHFQGSEKFQALHDRFFDLVQANIPLPPVTFEVQGAKFRGLAFPGQNPPGVKLPDGFFIGNKGNHYYVGISRAGLTEYMTPAAAGSSGPAKLSGSSVYQKGVAACGKGHMRMMLNLEPLWTLADMYMPALGPDAMEVKALIDVLAAQNMRGHYLAESFKPDGTEQSALVQITSKDGIWSLIPKANAPMTIPSFVPKEATTAVTMKLEVSDLMGLVRRVVKAVGGDEATKDFESELAQMKEETGIDPAKVLACLDGQFAMAQLAGGGAPAGMMEINPNVMFGLRIKDQVGARQLMETFMAQPEAKNAIKSESFQGGKIHVVREPAYDEDFEPEEIFAFAMEGDWAVMAMSSDDLKKALSTLKGDASGTLASDPQFKAAMGNANGIGVGYVNTAASMADVVDTIRPIMGFLPMMMGEMGQNPDIRFLLDPANLPSRETFHRYFGVSTTTVTSVADGVHVRSWSPRVYKGGAAPKTKPKGEKGEL